MTRRDTIALTLLLLACFGLAIFVRASAAGTVSTGSDSLGQYLAAMAVLRGGEPFVPNPEGGHALWAWVLPLVAVAPSLTGLIELAWWPASNYSGDYGIGFWGKKWQGEDKLQKLNAEMANGRLAMLGVAGNMLAEGQTGMTFKEQLLALNFNPFA